jgi:nucleotide-binding universal stress UspA family protein
MQFRRVVVGIDFSESSLATARWIAHNLAPDAELVLVHVVRSDERSLARRYMPRVLDELRVIKPELQGGLRGLGELLGAGRTRTEILSGDSAVVLAFVAAQVGADLIGVGRGPHGRGSARFGATTPHRLIARTDLPVLVAPHVPLSAPTRILVPFDDRASGRAVLQSAARIASGYEATLDALHVIETDPSGRAARKREEKHEGPCDYTQRWAAMLVDNLDLPSGRAASFIHPGDAGEEIVSHARRSGAGLIVMGTGERPLALRGDTHARHVGSTTRFVIWAAPCPVLALPRGAVAPTLRMRPARALDGLMAQV